MNAAMPVLPPDLVSLADYERHARARVPEALWAFLDGAGGDGITHAANRAAFDSLCLESRVLADMAGAHTRSTLLGMELDMPVILAPVALQKIAHPDGEIATVKAASATKTWMTVSTQSSTSLEDIAAAADTALWFQLYMQPSRDATLALVRRAEAAGYRAIMLTVDAPVNGVRTQEARAGFSVPPGISAVNISAQAAPALRNRPGESPVFNGLLDVAPGWRDLEWLRAATRLPLIVKGVLHPDDAARALDTGAEGIAVSNHGGRTLDTLPATLHALPRIVERVAGRAPVLLDGGVRRGTDVVKALALGAQAVMIGRPVVHALAVGGALGVAHMLTLLRAELEVAMALTGCPRLASITRDVLFNAPGNSPARRP